VERDFTEAARWYRKAADQGYYFAQANLGFCYLLGRGVGKDPDEAVRWFCKAAKQGHYEPGKALVALGKVMVKGTVLKGGKPIPVSKFVRVVVTLIPVVKERRNYTTYTARADEQGNFETDQPVPLGKYKIAVYQGGMSPFSPDALQGAFGPNNTKIIRDIDGETLLQIDIAKPGGWLLFIPWQPR
jgi:TPR repeat protein